MAEDRLTRPMTSAQFQEWVAGLSQVNAVMQLLVLLGLRAAGLAVRVAARTQARSRRLGLAGRAGARRRAVSGRGAGAGPDRAARPAGVPSDAGSVPAGDSHPLLAARDPCQREGAALRLPHLAADACHRAVHFLARVDRHGAVGHRPAAHGAGRARQHHLEDRLGEDLAAQPDRGPVQRGRRDGGRLVDLGGDRGAAAALDRQPLDPQDRCQCGALAAAVHRADLCAVGGGHRPHCLVGARRRGGRGPGLRPAEAGFQLRERLRDPGRALGADRRPGEGRQLRGPHHRHQHPLHGDPVRQRSRVHRAQRDC